MDWYPLRCENLKRPLAELSLHLLGALKVINLRSVSDLRKYFQKGLFSKFSDRHPHHFYIEDPPRGNISNLKSICFFGPGLQLVSKIFG